MSDRQNTVSRQEVFEAICESLLINPDELTEETVISELGPIWDSVGMLTVLTSLDTYSDGSISPEDIVEVKTVGDLIDLVFTS